MPQNSRKSGEFITAVIVNLSTISFGISSGWPSPVIPQLRSSHPPVGDTAFTNDQISWISSLPSIGGLFIIPFCATISERIGRKNFSILTGLPHILSWILIIIAQNDIYLYASRLATGFGGAMTLFIAPLYTSEIASVNIRGTLGSFVLFAINIGVLFAYVAGAFLSFRLLAVACLIFPTVYVVAICFVPETPVYLVRRNRQLQAHKSLMFYRGNNPALIEQELMRLQSHVKTCDTSSRTINLSDLFNDRSSRKGLIISMGLIAAQRFSGITGVTVYSQTIFNLSGSSISPALAPIIIALIQIAGSQMSTMLMERAGRRLLSLISCVGMIVSYSALAVYFYLQRNMYDINSISWLPLVALSSYIVSYCLGIGPMPFVIVAEVFKLNVTTFANTVCFFFFFVVAFFAIRMFDLAMKFSGPDGCFLVHAIIGLISLVFCYSMLPETKGRKREDIVEELAGIDQSCPHKKINVDKSSKSKLLANNESV